MKANKLPLQIKAMIAVLLAACHSLYGGIEPLLKLGGGEPGLKIIYKSTNQFVLYLDEAWTVGPGLAGGLDERQLQVILDHNYGLKERFQNRTEKIDIPQQLYAFDENTAFSCEGGSWTSDYKTWKYWPRDTQVFSLNGDGIMVSTDVYAMARDHYGFTSNQLFLGKIGPNVYYWETRDPRRVFYRSFTSGIATNCLELPKGIVDIFGVTRGVSEKENIGFVVFRKSRGLFSYASQEFGFVEVSLKTAKTVKGP